MATNLNNFKQPILNFSKFCMSAWLFGLTVDNVESREVGGLGWISVTFHVIFQP